MLSESDQEFVELLGSVHNKLRGKTLNLQPVPNVQRILKILGEELRLRVLLVLYASGDDPPSLGQVRSLVEISRGGIPTPLSSLSGIMTEIKRERLAERNLKACWRLTPLGEKALEAYALSRLILTPELEASEQSRLREDFGSLAVTEVTGFRKGVGGATEHAKGDSGRQDVKKKQKT